MNMTYKPRVYFISNVFTDKEIGSNEKISENIRDKIKSLWQKLNQISEIKYFKGRFPSEDLILKEVKDFNPGILGCHLSHQISLTILRNSNIPLPRSPKETKGGRNGSFFGTLWN